MKTLIKKYFTNFVFFYQYLEYKIFFAVLINILIGVLDGFGLAMFLPLLRIASEGKSYSQAGNDGSSTFSFIFDGLNYLGLEMSLQLILVMMVIFFVLKGIVKYFGSVYRVFLQQYFIKKLRTKMLTRFNKIGYRHFILADVGRIQNTMTGEVDRVARGFSMYFLSFEQFILAIVYIVFAFTVEAKFAFFVTLGGLSTNIIYRTFYKLIKSSSKNLTAKSNIYQGLIIQHVSNFKYLKATGLLDNYGNKLRSTINLIEASRKKIGLYNNVLGSMREPLLVIVVSVVIFIQVSFLGGDIGPIMVSLLFFYRSLTALTGMQTTWSKFLETSGSIDNLQEFQDFLLESADTYGSKQFTKLNSSFELQQVSVVYTDKAVLDDVSLKVDRNESIALVGESGSGKTTLVNILSGLIKPDSGSFIIDGVNAEKIDIRTYQSRIGYVTQEAVIFNDTIFNNVTFWAEQNEQNLQRFRRALEMASILDFVYQLPAKENTLLGVNGINVSGGQKQRISIARELYKDIDILILDEATSALDTETEKVIQESVDKLKGNYTIVMVAHRLSTIRNVDRVVLMRAGKIIGIDTFTGLRESNASFRKMVELQEISI